MISHLVCFSDLSPASWHALLPSKTKAATSYLIFPWALYNMITNTNHRTKHQRVKSILLGIFVPCIWYPQHKARKHAVKRSRHREMDYEEFVEPWMENYAGSFLSPDPPDKSRGDTSDLLFRKGVGLEARKRRKDGFDISFILMKLSSKSTCLFSATLSSQFSYQCRVWRGTCIFATLAIGWFCQQPLAGTTCRYNMYSCTTPKLKFCTYEPRCHTLSGIDRFSIGVFLLFLM